MQLVFATGAVTPVGLNTQQTCAAVRARLSGVEATVAQAPPNDRLLAAPVPAHASIKRSMPRWLARLALRALRECLAAYAGEPSRLALFIALPEPFRDHEITRDGSGHAFVARLVRSLGLRLSSQSRVLLGGHASTAAAWQVADALLQAGQIDAALIGGVDSLINDPDRDRLDAAGRLHRPGQPFGLIPGEAAAFVLSGSDRTLFKQPPLASVLGAAQAHEADTLRSDRYAVGIGLQHAIRGALQNAGIGEGDIGWRVTDVNGERYRSWESSLLLAREYRTWRDGLPCLHVPGFTGDVGAASLPLQVLLAAQGMFRGQAPSPFAVCESSSEDTLRGACIVCPAPGASAPPFRTQVQHRATAPGADPAVMTSQTERLPHEVGWLAARRAQLVRGRSSFAALAAFDDRLDATLDVLRSCSEAGWQSTLASLEMLGDSGLFVAGVLALESGDVSRLARVLKHAQAPGAQAALFAAFGWVSPRLMRGVVPALARSCAARARLAAVAALHLHRVSPGALLDVLLADEDVAVRARTLRLIGEAGLVDAGAALSVHLAHADPTLRFWSAWSAVLLGARDDALALLQTVALSAHPLAPRALALLLRAAPAHRQRATLQALAQAADAPAGVRRLIEACGISGNVHHVPWLIERTREPVHARIAGEALRIVTGLPLDSVRLEPAPPVQRPSDDPNVDDVADDPDADLPWPDSAQVAAWWQAHHARFDDRVRWWLGQPVGVDAARAVLANTRDALQCDRAAAAQWLCVLQPGTPLCAVDAPAWRQQAAAR